MINGPAVNVADYGASTSASGAVNYAALKAAYDSGAAIIQMPAGAFAISQTLYVDRGVRIDGAGAQDGSGNNGQTPGLGTTTLAYTGTGNCIDIVGSYTEGVSNVHLSNFMITGNILADGGIFVGSGIGASKCTFKNLGIFGFTNATANKGYGLGIKNCLESVFENIYVQGCQDGFNIGFGACTSLEFHSCFSRVNSQYGWNIRQGNGSSFYQCLAEGNLKTGLVLNPSTGQNLSQLAFYSWYSEFNGDDADTYPGALIKSTGTGTCSFIQFYSPIFYDYSTYNYSTDVWDIACIKLGVVSNVSFQNAGIVSVNANFMECQIETTLCSWDSLGNSSTSSLITGNVYNNVTGRWNVAASILGQPYFSAGTFSITVVSGGTQSGTSSANYQRIGNVVTVSGSLVVTDITGGATNLVLGTLPFSAGSTCVIGAVEFIDYTSIYVTASSTNINISGATPYTGAGSSVYFGITYFV
tara:strand:- start:567 stop:1979 length:1413 start_codon:yes stop_codon:yes gene_type:complete